VTVPSWQDAVHSNNGGKSLAPCNTCTISTPFPSGAANVLGQFSSQVLLNCHLLLETMRRSPPEDINYAGNQERDRRSNPLWSPSDTQCKMVRLDGGPKK